MSRSEHHANAWLAQAAEIKREREERAKLLALGAARRQRSATVGLPAGQHSRGSLPVPRVPRGRLADGRRGAIVSRSRGCVWFMVALLVYVLLGTYHRPLSAARHAFVATPQ